MSESVSERDYGWVHPAVLSDLRDDGRLANLEATPIVASFVDAYDHLSHATDSVIIPKDCVDDPRKFDFCPSWLSIRWGATRTYRDPHPEHSMQLWEYDTYYVARLNRYNPERGRFVEHALTDKIHYTLGAGVAALAAYELWRGVSSDE